MPGPPHRGPRLVGGDMTSPGASRASSRRSLSFMDPTEASIVKEREKAVTPSFPPRSPSRHPSAKSGVSAVPTSVGAFGGSPEAAQTDTTRRAIEAFLNDARNAVGNGSPPGGPVIGGGNFVSPASRTGGSVSGRTSPGKTSPPTRGVSHASGLIWNAPLPGDAMKPSRVGVSSTIGSPGTPALFHASGTNNNNHFMSGYGGENYSSPSRVASRLVQNAQNYPFDSTVDPAIRWGIKNLGGNLAVATSILPTQASQFGVSGSRFGDLYGKERAASVSRFREMALMRDKMRFHSVDGIGADDAVAKKVIDTLQAQVAQLSTQVNEFQSGHVSGDDLKNAVPQPRFDSLPRDSAGNAPRGSGRDLSPERSRMDSRAPSIRRDLSPVRRSQINSRAPSLINSRAPSVGRPGSPDAMMSKSNSHDDVRFAGNDDSKNFAGNDDSKHFAGNDDSKHFLESVHRVSRAEVGDALLRGETSPVPQKADSVRFAWDTNGRYLRTTRRDMENDRNRNVDLNEHAGSPSKTVGGTEERVGALGTTDGGSLGGRETRRENGQATSRGGREIRRENGTEGHINANGIFMHSRHVDTDGQNHEIDPDAAAAFAAALSAIDARREKKLNDPSIQIARLKEHNRSLRRELGMAQRLMTGYHAQLMTGGVGVGVSRLVSPAQLQEFGGATCAPPPSYHARRPSRAPFQGPSVRGGREGFTSVHHASSSMRNNTNRGNYFQVQPGPTEPAPFLRSTRRAESKRIAAELGVLRAERAFAETAWELDEDEDEDGDDFDDDFGDDSSHKQVLHVTDKSTEGTARGYQGHHETQGCAAGVKTSQIAKDVAELKALVGDLVSRMDLGGVACKQEPQPPSPRLRSQVSSEISFGFNDFNKSHPESSMSSRGRDATERDETTNEPSVSNETAPHEKAPSFHSKPVKEETSTAAVQSPTISLETNTAFLGSEPPSTPTGTPTSKAPPET